MNARVLSVGVLLAVLGSTPAVAREPLGGVYIVRLAADPIATYAGPGPTSPSATGRRISPGGTAVRAYRARLDGIQRSVIERAGSSITPRASYRYAVAGFAARLTTEQRSALAADDRVASVEPNTGVSLDADASTPPATALGGPVAPQGAQFLGLPDGLWSRLGGPMSLTGAGAGQVVGVIDTGLDPDLPSVAAASESNSKYLGADFPAAPSSFHGICQAPAGGQPASAAFACSNKVVGARWYQTSLDASQLASTVLLSPRDTDGHGTHVATTAAGNYGVDPSFGAGLDADVDVISGIAPRAQVAVYKVCWDVVDGSGTCPASDLLAAFDGAVADGVSAINLSIGTSRTGLPVAVAYAVLSAQAAGIGVAQSAGNSGSGSNTVGETTANWWALAVGATSGAGSGTGYGYKPIDSDAAGASAKLDIPSLSRHYRGASSLPRDSGSAPVRQPRLQTLTVVDAINYVAGGSTAGDARTCKPGALAGIPAGAMVICSRVLNSATGANPSLAQKGAAVRDGGGGTGAWVLLANDNNADARITSGTLPMFLLGKTDADDLRTLLASASVTDATLEQPVWRPETPDLLGRFSSRGPSTAIDAVMPVAVTAPGIDVLAGWPEGQTTDSAANGFSFLTGTSMASPQVAGTLALLRQGHPTWTPAQLRSALVTTGAAVGLPPLNPVSTPVPASMYDAGGGRIDPQRANDPGLLVDETPARYRAAGRSADPTIDDLGPLFDPADLDVPYVVLRQVLGSRTVKRTFTNVGGSTSSWSVSAAAPAGWQVDISPASFSLAAGRRQTGSLTASYASGSTPAEGRTALVLAQTAGGGRVVTLPVGLARPSSGAVNARQPANLETVTADGSGRVPVRTRDVAWAAASTVTPLAPIVAEAPHTLPDGTCQANTIETGHSHGSAVAVPAGASDLIVRTNAVPGTDVDVYLSDPDGGLDYLANTSSGNEVVRVPSPKAGTWTAWVIACTPGATYVLDHAVLGTGTAVSVAATANVPAGTRYEPELSWTGLPAGDHAAVLKTTDGGSTIDDIVFVHRRAAPVPGSGSATTTDAAGAATANVPFQAEANPAGAPTWLRVEYGPTTDYGATTESVPLGSGAAMTSVSLTLPDVPIGSGHARIVLERRGQVLATGGDVAVTVTGVPPVDTPTPSPVPTDTPTATPTASPTATATATSAATAAPTASATSVPTATSTATATATPPPTGGGSLLTDAVAAACGSSLTKKAGPVGTVTVTRTGATLAVKVKAGAKGLKKVAASLRTSTPCGGVIVKAVKLGTIKARKSRTAKLALAAGLRAGTYLVVVDGKRGKTALRSAKLARL